MDYTKIVTVLKRYSFESKMQVSEHLSRYLLDGAVIDSDKISMGEVSPWEAELFAMLSIHAVEWQKNQFADKRGARLLNNIINAIRAYIPPKLLKYKETGEIADKFLMVALQLQSPSQIPIFFKLYRYSYYYAFSNEQINMPGIFKEKTGCNHKKLVNIALCIWLLYNCTSIESRAKLDFKFIYDTLYDDYKNELESLTITREEYINELNNSTSSIADYVFCVRPSYTYPFVNCDGSIYCPLPHLLIDSVTSSMMYKMTKDDDRLRQIIGKEVFESYLYQMVNSSPEFDEVLPEHIYNRNNRTPDVMAAKDNFIVFFDSKSLVPKRSLRLLDEEAESEYRDRLAKYCAQLYKHLHDKFAIDYNFFENRKDITLENRFGLVVVVEQPFISLLDIYQQAADCLCINTDSEEYNWLCLHIGIVDLYSIERYCYTGSSLINCLKRRYQKQALYDTWLEGSIENTLIINNDFSIFQNNAVDSAKELVIKYDLYKAINIE